jgi:hypothetical protein
MFEDEQGVALADDDRPQIEQCTNGQAEIANDDGGVLDADMEVDKEDSDNEQEVSIASCEADEPVNHLTLPPHSLR